MEFDGAAIHLDGAAVDVTGTFTGSFVVPEAVAGKHTIKIYDSGGQEDTLTFTVIPGWLFHRKPGLQAP